MDEGPADLVTRHQAAQMLGCSHSAVRQWETRGELTPVKRGRETVLDRREVEALVARRTERPRADSLHIETAAREAAAFEAFEQGLDVVGVVVSLKMRPSHVMQLHVQYTKVRAHVTLQGEPLRVLADALGVDPSELGAQKIVELVSRLRERLRSSRRDGSQAPNHSRD